MFGAYLGCISTSRWVDTWTGTDAVLAAIQTIQSAAGKGATDEQLKDARALQRKAQWRLDFVSAENSMGFHAPQESARILGEAIDYGRQAEIQAREQGGVPGGPVADDGKPRADAR